MNILRKSVVQSMMDDPALEGIDEIELLHTLDKLYVKGKEGKPTEVRLIVSGKRGLKKPI